MARSRLVQYVLPFLFIMVAGGMVEPNRKALYEVEEKWRRVLAEIQTSPASPSFPPLDLSSLENVMTSTICESPASKGNKTISSSRGKRRAALCFFGQVKNISNREVEAFIENILQPLLQVFPKIDIFLHTYNVQTFKNPRNDGDDTAVDVAKSIELLMSKILTMKESSSSLTEGEICFKQTQIEISQLQDADASFQDLKYYLHRGDPWENQGVSMLYFLRQLYSLDRVTQLWERAVEGKEKEEYQHNVAQQSRAEHPGSSCSASGKETGGLSYYDAVIYTRPDLFFFDSLPVPLGALSCSRNDTSASENEDDLLCLQSTFFPVTLEEGTLYTPTFDQYHGLNDRFALGSPSVMRIYGHRLHLVDQYFAMYPNMKLSAEPFLYKTMVDMSGMKNVYLQNFTFSRVRADRTYGAT